ncbi:enkurin, partial [Copidosoma floridanum]|uniref:enkurin n=1 Tax=Copidosoma floridanum TaxID=29053 RepID=UPI0006C96165
FKDIRNNFKDKKPLCVYVTEDQRKELLYALKTKWEKTIKKFQCLPFLVDSVAKIRRKTSLEEKLKQLEENINELDRHPYIYVYDDNNSVR